MRKLMTVLLLAVFAVSFAADKTTAVFTLDHQMSTHCEKKIKENLRFEKGVNTIEVSLEKNTITIDYNPKKTNPENLIEGFKKIGFNASEVGKASNVSDSGCCGSCSEKE
ncbi:MAG: heavy-metal-associated domain-containing protein [Paramuribaculum sp.]|nr:heavy-metal-associated domain-containing protein [Paramuribaculum sp.]